MSYEGNGQNVIVTDIRMPFFSMVIFMVKGKSIRHLKELPASV